MRKLASIRRVAEIKPIEGADKIVKARVDGWWLVTAIDNGIMVNDLVIYFEIDSFLPVEDRYEFLRKGCFKSTTNLGDGFRLKTIKLRGQISQGLIMPLTRSVVDGVPEYTFLDKDGNETVAHEGDDVTELLGVQKFEKPIPLQLSGQIKGDFPWLIRKTDQERVQNILGELMYDIDCEWEPSLKLDGSSMTVYHKAGEIGVCSRNIDLIETPDNAFWRVARALKIPQQIQWLGKNLAFQGELMGPGVQGNREWLKDHTFFLFDIWDIDAQRYYTPYERKRIVTMINDSGFTLPHVYTFPNKRLRDFGTTEEEIRLALLEEAKGPSIYNPIREGIVYKKLDGSMSFKVISDDFLMKEKD